MPADFDGVVLGEYADEKGGVAHLSDNDRRRHAYCVGKTGTGKSTLLESIMHSDMVRGRGFALLDPHGDLAQRVADSVPHSRFNDVIYVDPADPDFHLGFNPLHNIPFDKRSLVTAQVVETFAHIWNLSLEGTPRLLYILHNTVRLLLDTPGSTLLGIQKALVDGYYRRHLLANVRDPSIRNFWQEEFAQLSERDAALAVASIQNKVGMLLGGPMRAIFGQVRPTLDFRRVMDEGKICLVNLSKGRLGAGPVHLLGASIATAFAQAAEGRSSIPEAERRDFTLFADEFEHFATDSFVGTLSESRKLRLNLMLSHQFLAQLPPYLRQAVIGNVGSIIAFRIGGEDEEALRPDMKNTELVYDQSSLAYLNIAAPIQLTATPNFSAWVRLLQDGAPTDTRLVQLYAPEATITGRLVTVRNHTRARYLRPRRWVEERINRFMASRPSPPKRKKPARRAAGYRVIPCSA